MGFGLWSLFFNKSSKDGSILRQTYMMFYSIHKCTLRPFIKNNFACYFTNVFIYNRIIIESYQFHIFILWSFRQMHNEVELCILSIQNRFFVHVLLKYVLAYIPL